MKTGNQNILIPTSMVGNYPNPRWWDASFARHFTGDQPPPDSFWSVSDTFCIRLNESAL